MEPTAVGEATEVWLPKTSSALLGLCFEEPASSQRNRGESAYAAFLPTR